MPAFFVPVWTAANGPKLAEDHYQYLARRCRTVAPHDHDERVYSITWVQDGEEWTATVGHRLYNHPAGLNARDVPQVPTVGAAEWERDPFAYVTAIFPGPEFHVSTTGSIVKDPMFRWRNPFVVDEPTSIEYFES